MSSERSAGANPLGVCGTPTIYNVTLTEADTEYVQHLPVDCRKFTIRARVPGQIIKLSSRRQAKFLNALVVVCL